MGYANGKVPLTALTTIDGVPLLNSAAAGYKLWKHIAHLEGDTLTPAHPLYGSGYRDLACQIVYFKASQGDEAAAAKAGISINLHVTVANPGYSSHGGGDRLDVAWNGHAIPTKAQLELAARYGWTREFGSADENHFQFDGRTHTPTEADKNRIVCRELNGRNLGETSTTDEDGLWPVESKFSLMLQQAGHADHLYPTPQYKIDGKAGTRTRWLRDHYFNVIWAR